MVYAIVPQKVRDAIEAMIPKSAHAWMEVRGGRGYEIKADPWEDVERVWRAEDIIAEARRVVRKMKRRR